jgi:hypothetical protein
LWWCLWGQVTQVINETWGKNLLPLGVIKK